MARASSSRPPAFGGRYAGRVAVVTGASRGLGEQLCRDLARAGAVVVGLARDEGRLRALAPQLAAISPGSRTEVCDVADTAALRAVLERTEHDLGPVDVLVNNAATDPGIRLVEITEEDFRHTFDVNFFAPVAATLAVQAAMAERGRGIIVNVSSDGGRLPSPGPGAYPSSKAALSAFSESISFRLGPKGVHVHVVYPAFMATELGLDALGTGIAPAAAPDDALGRDGLATDPGPGRRAVPRDQRLGADRRRDGLPRPAPPPVPPPAPELVAPPSGLERCPQCCDLPTIALRPGSAPQPSRLESRSLRTNEEAVSFAKDVARSLPCVWRRWAFLSRRSNRCVACAVCPYTQTGLAGYRGCGECRGRKTVGAVQQGTWMMSRSLWS